jgi:hypothetical protein
MIAPIRREKPQGQCASRARSRTRGDAVSGRHDAKLATAVFEIANPEAPPTRLLQPAVVMRVIRGNFGRRSGGTEAAPAGAQA